MNVEVAAAARGAATLADIEGQAAGWVAAARGVAECAEALTAALRDRPPRHVVITGCGSPLFLASTAATLWQRALGDAVVTVHPASEVASAAGELVVWPSHTWLVAISRSGATTEVIEAVDAFRRVGGAMTLCVTCRSDSPLARSVDLAVPLDDGFEASVAQTRSFSSMLVAIESLAGVFGGGAERAPAAVPAECRVAVESGQRLVGALAGLEAFERIDFLGSGPLYGLAREAMLKMTEMALTPSAAYHFPEYRHGPKSMVDEGALVVGLVGGTSAAHELAVLDEVIALGASTLVIEPHGSLATVMPAVQLLAHARAVGRGLDPDAPRHLSAVVELDRTRTTTGFTEKGEQP